MINVVHAALFILFTVAFYWSAGVIVGERQMPTLRKPPPKADHLLIAQLEHECEVAGHEEKCRPCASAAAVKRIEWARARGRELGILSPAEQQLMMKAALDPYVIDVIAKRWGTHTT